MLSQYFKQVKFIIIITNSVNSDSVYLVSQHLRSGLLSLLLVDELHQDSLVLEHVSLGLEVQFMIQVTVNLLGLSENRGNKYWRHILRVLSYIEVLFMGHPVGIGSYV